MTEAELARKQRKEELRAADDSMDLAPKERPPSTKRLGQKARATAKEMKVLSTFEEASACSDASCVRRNKK